MKEFEAGGLTPRILNLGNTLRPVPTESRLCGTQRKSENFKRSANFLPPIGNRTSFLWSSSPQPSYAYSLIKKTTQIKAGGNDQLHTLVGSASRTRCRQDACAVTSTHKHMHRNSHKFHTHLIPNRMIYCSWYISC